MFWLTEVRKRYMYVHVSSFLSQSYRYTHKKVSVAARRTSCTCMHCHCSPTFSQMTWSSMVLGDHLPLLASQSSLINLAGPLRKIQQASSLYIGCGYMSEFEFRQQRKLAQNSNIVEGDSHSVGHFLVINGCWAVCVVCNKTRVICIGARGGNLEQLPPPWNLEMMTSCAVSVQNIFRRSHQMPVNLV